MITVGIFHVYSRYNGIPFNLQSEGNSNIQDNMDKPQGHSAQCNKPIAKRQKLFVSFTGGT
jgi:hypothetical protein